MVSVGIGGFLWRYMAHKERRADERFDRMETKPTTGSTAWRIALTA